MVGLTKNVNVFVTNTEIEALLLECNLIKRFKPRFNIILRDDKSFPYVIINKQHEIPRVQKYRGPKKLKADYYGPFVSPSIADFTIVSLQKIFLLRSCSDSIFKNRSRPCLLYDIKRCSAPCVNYISKKKYLESLQDSKKFLLGNTKKIEKKLFSMMKEASKNKNFEEAAKLRDRIKSINQIQKYQSVYIKDMRNIDIFAIKAHENKSCVHGMFYRNGSNYGNKSFFPLHEIDANEYEILESFLFQFYEDKEPPPKILINLDNKYFKNVENLLNKKNSNKLTIFNPKSGEKNKHIKLAEKNALENLKIKKNSLDNHIKSMNMIKNFLSLEVIPKRIEVYDNSHTFGNQPVGVMIVVDQEGFNNKNYRKFNIKFKNNGKNISKINDYYMIEEVLDRRLKKINDEGFNNLPDIIIIDGGKGHLNSANKIIKRYKLNSISLLAVAKGVKRNSGREIIHTKNDQIILKPNDELLFFIQRIRDEAHRFAINSHRKRRDKNIKKSIFEEIKGIGPRRKKALINHFGSFQAIKEASFTEISKVKGINNEIANQIYGFFNSH
tara:strand:- start:93 stop:1754 length:1662 start_codon:yes stop_codon:yes gene_type:complete